MVRKHPPPSRVSSKGGGGVVGKVVWLESTPPLSHVSSEGGGGVVRKYPPPSRILSDRGGVVGKVPPSISHFEQGRGWWLETTRVCHGFCHGFIWGMGQGTDICTPTKPIPSHGYGGLGVSFSIER